MQAGSSLVVSGAKEGFDMFHPHHEISLKAAKSSLLKVLFSVFLMF